MLSPIELYHNNKLNNPEIVNKSYDILFRNYITKNLQGKDKLIDIDSTDQESLISTLNGGLPLPGFIYTFIYKGPDLVSYMNNKEFKFQDFIPLSFCLNISKEGFSGINFNMLPHNVRLSFLQQYYITFKTYFKDIENLTENNKLAVNKDFISYVTSGKGLELLKMFNQSRNAHYDFAYRKYLYKNIQNLRMIEIQEFQYIPWYNPKDAFRKIEYSTIQKLYHKL